MRIRVSLALLLVAGCLSCSDDDVTSSQKCSPGEVCGFEDHVFTSTYDCGTGQLAYTWRDHDHCVQQCVDAQAAGCDVSACDCSEDLGTGNWLPCIEANGGEVCTCGCILMGSGPAGEVVPCDCR
jgi:hypothetical protein